MNYELKTRSASEIIDAAAVLLRNHFAALVGPTAVICAVTAVLQQLGAWAVLHRLTWAIGPKDYAFSLTVALPSYFLEAFVLQAFLINAVSSEYLGKQWTVMTIVERMSRVGWKYVAVSIIGTLQVFFLSLLLIIPGIMRAASLLFSSHVALLEDVDTPSSLKRSTYLTDGRRLALFGLLFAAGVLQATAGAGLNALFPKSVAVLPFIGPLIQQITQLITPFVTCVTVVAYYDCRVRKEGFDLQVMTERLDAVGAGTVAAPAGVK